MMAGTPAVPVAVNVALREPAVAVSVFTPTVVPSVQLPAVAIPLAFVVAVSPVTDPAPVATANVTPTPATGLPFASLPSTAGLVATAVPTVADCASPAVLAITAAAPGVPVALSVVVSEPAVAVRLFGPAVLPSVQLPTAAMPL